ncbi:MAG: hypothetical protein HY518_05115 [Candidatus Aenigmarchaeota archaeon]|nr:hypothetical protein [Candidatus Aenigmarchaeota archaeon]
MAQDEYDVERIKSGFVKRLISYGSSGPNGLTRYYEREMRGWDGSLEDNALYMDLQRHPHALRAEVACRAINRIQKDIVHAKSNRA